MKFLMVALIISLASCGARKTDGSSGKTSGESLKCEVPATVTGSVSIDQKQIETVRSELHGREFSKDAFWSRLSRETRLSLNLAINKQIGNSSEELIYKGVALFFENIEKNGKESFEINAEGKRIVIVNDGDSSAPVRGGCQENQKELAKIDTKKVIHESTLQRKLQCDVSGTNLELRVYQNHIVSVLENTIIGFSGAEAIRTENGDDISVDALNSAGETMKLNLGWTAIDIRLFGKTRSLVGTGKCF